jgi:hypothetical protein
MVVNLLGDVLPNMRSSGRAVNKVPSLSLCSTCAMVRYRAAQLWR